MKYSEVKTKHEDLVSEAGVMLRRFLRENGWKYNCVGNPGSQWFWERQWEGKRWMYPDEHEAFRAHGEMFWQEIEAEDEQDGEE